MAHNIVSTIGLKCRRCYSCVRECPATAIRVLDGQAVVIDDRCISCGHCVKVCSLDAKSIASEIDKVLYEFIPSGNTIAIIAPAFAASFPDQYLQLPTALRKIGFSKVCETAFGADLVSNVYAEYLKKNNDKTIISTPCPAIYNFIEMYYPGLVENLAEIVSPMVAMGKYLKKNLGSDAKVVFIGPCVAKKSEYQDKEVEGIIDSVLTFVELKEIFKNLKIDLDSMEPSDFDPPYANMGKSFPLTGGLLKAAEISSDILAKDIIVVDGKDKVKEIIKDIANDKIKSKFVDILFCEGCINGPAIDSELNYYSKREKVIEFIEKQITHVDKRVWKSDVYNSRDIDFSRKFASRSKRRPQPSEEKIKEILAKTNKITSKDELNCGACGYLTCRDYAIAIAKDLAEEDMCLPFLIEKIESAYTELKNTKDQLQNAEKLASIGQLAAGIAHEINNPLGTIMLYSSMLKREFEQKECAVGNVDDFEMIIDEAKRCKNIVANLLNFARQGKLHITEFNIKEMIQSILKTTELTWKDSEVFLNFNDDCQIEIIEADKDQLKQVVLNLINNAYEAMEDSEIKNLTVNLTSTDEALKIDVIDTGCGIPEENLGKLFTPFFTTKKIGKGTGLGLAISYGIIKIHKGDIKVKSSPDKGTTFTIKLPIKKK